jgi:hypothetical protein
MARCTQQRAIFMQVCRKRSPEQPADPHISPPLMDTARPSIFGQRPLLSSDDEKGLLQQAGFGDETLF